MKTALRLALVCAIALAACGPKPSTKPPKRLPPPDRVLDIQALINKTEDGGTVLIPFGQYTFKGGLVISDRRNLTFRCEPGTRILVESTSADIITVKSSSGITIENAYLRHVTPLQEYECHGAVVKLDASSNVTIINCELNGCGAVGVYGNNTNDILIRNCFVHHNTFNAFYFESCGDIKIQSCMIQDNGNLMQTYRCKGLEMRDNSIKRNGGYWKGHPDPKPGLKDEGRVDEGDR